MCMGERPLLSELAAHQETGLRFPRCTVSTYSLNCIQCAEMSLKFRLCLANLSIPL